MKNRTRGVLGMLVSLALFSILNSQFSTCLAFEGRIRATLEEGGQNQTFFYTVGTNGLRIERGETDRPYTKDVVNLDSGDITLLFPNNRSFVKLKAPAERESARPPGMPAIPALPPGVGQPSRALPGPTGQIGPTNLPGMSPPPVMPQQPNMPPMPQMPSGMSGGLPAMPMMPPMGMEPMELAATTDTTNLLGYPCTRYELKQRGEVMEIWATDKLLPYQRYLQNQPHRFGPQMMEEQWGDLLKAKKLFPLLAVLRFEAPPGPVGATPAAPGPERLRFEVNSITLEKITDDTLFQPPPDYREIQPLPF